MKVDQQQDRRGLPILPRSASFLQAPLARRTLIGGLALAGATLALRPGSLLAEVRRGPHVVVIGAGLAGLVAAYELHRAGHQVSLIESAERPGGRLWTVRGPFADGLRAEMGAQTAGSGYKTLFSYVRHLGLGLSPFGAEPGVSRQERDVLLQLRGKRYLLSKLRADPSLWPLELTDAERAAAPFGLLSLYLGPIAKDIGDPANVTAAAFSRYDSMSLKDLLVSQGASPAALALIERPLNYNRSDSVSALSVLRDLCRRIVEQGAFEIQGGSDQLPRGLAQRLRSVISYGVSLRRIERRREGFRLALERQGTMQALEADRVVLAVPFTVLRDIEMTPALNDLRMEAITDLPYTQVSKTYVQTRTRFFRKSASFTAAYTDTPTERLFDVSDSRTSERGLLLNWINGEQLMGLGTEAQISDRVLMHLNHLFPGAKDEVESVVTTNWAEHYSRGAYAHYAPGQLRRFAEVIAKPVDGLFFAGEHTELAAPGMEGAMVSGVRAAQQVVESLE